jgi:hypothetical protein
MKQCPNAIGSCGEQYSEKGNEQIRIECAVDRFGNFISFPEETLERLKRVE